MLDSLTVSLQFSRHVVVSNILYTTNLC